MVGRLMIRGEGTPTATASEADAGTDTGRPDGILEGVGDGGKSFVSTA